MKLSLLLWLVTLFPQPLADHTCLATTVYLEARSQPTIGQLAVAEVAMRRRERGEWGSTVCQVVKAPHQFATTTTPGTFDLTNVAAFEKAWRVAGASLRNWERPARDRHFLVPHADHFATLAAVPGWAGSNPGTIIGDHRFYAIN